MSGSGVRSRGAGRAGGQGMRALLGGVTLAVGFFGCVDLFHSTDFNGCKDGQCVDASSHDATAKADGGHHDAATAREGGAHDGGTHDAATHDAVSHHDAADAHEDVGSRDAGLDVAKDAAAPPTNFCAWSVPEAEAHAQHACLWLGACEGADSLNAFTECYGSAMLAYACTANPSEQVTGPVHAFWDALWKVKSCSDVASAIFPEGVPTCTAGTSVGCGSDLNGAPYDDVAIICAEAGAPPVAAQNCAVAGFTCVGGSCFLADDMQCPDASTVASPGSCTGTVLHLCELTQGYGGPNRRSDVGRDCRYVGAGACEVDGGIAGCRPSDASAGVVPDSGVGSACDAGPLASCSASGRYALGCATGRLEVLDCVALGGTCSITHLVPSQTLEQACFSPINCGGQIPTCFDGGFVTNATVGCTVNANCAEAGLGGCDQSTTLGGCLGP